MAKTVIKYAKELVDTIGREQAIGVFNKRINEIASPMSFEDLCKVSAWKTAIDFINGYIKFKNL